MSDTKEQIQNTNDFLNLHSKSYRLAAAVFTISNVMDDGEELRTRIRKLSLELVSLSVELKDINFSDIRKLITEVQKKTIELMSMLDIASIAGLISKMNGNILKEEFQNFISELEKFSNKFEDDRNVSVNSILLSAENLSLPAMQNSYQTQKQAVSKPAPMTDIKSVSKNGGSRRKDMRKSMILEFIKGHNNVSIKDIVPNIIGCSEKTVQRELMVLINEGRIKKVGERRWSKYSTI